MSDISSEMIERANVHITKTASRKEQSLKQFREWIEKHPFIKNLHAGVEN